MRDSPLSTPGFFDLFTIWPFQVERVSMPHLRRCMLGVKVGLCLWCGVVVFERDNPWLILDFFGLVVGL